MAEIINLAEYRKQKIIALSKKLPKALREYAKAPDRNFQRIVKSCLNLDEIPEGIDIEEIFQALKETEREKTK